MPWLLSSQLERLSASPSQRQCERTSFAFYCSVREQLPVWMLEDMRSMEVFCWEDGRPRAFLPSEALLYALVHNHQDYARYLLNRYSVSALRALRCSFCCHSSGSPHLTVAVRYDRVSILSMMVEALKDCDTQSKRQDYLDGCGGCSHVADAGKTAVQLAVELSRPDCLLLLLVHGAQADGLDAALQRLVSSNTTERRHAQRCLDFLLLFLPKLPDLSHHLQDERQRWQSLLGNEVFSWLCGLAPPPLLLQALRCLARSSPDHITALPYFLQLHSWQ
ncbi:ankyrin repeat domain-containing protein 9 [Siniperca chuatsi]|uniref:ankyrin repeat domain-containing protein 9 n=1 Tax=Siniperca chuatsi TaxID=119488 RepID=UPI001CE201E4|nr:ankyrin repeat domain-containing protein 9 [Siniperca chuatsi]